MKEINKMINIPFSPPDISEAEINEVADTLRSGWITTGPKVKKLEKKLAEYIGNGLTEKGTSRCVCLNSQTAAGELSLRMLGIGSQEGGSADDEVITCAYTYTASASVVAHIGAKLVLVDCCKDSIEIDYDAIENAITENTKAIIPVDIGGVPCDYDRLFEIVEKKKSLFKASSDIQKALGRVAVVCDAAHAIGAKAKFNGEWKMVGNIADFSNFSFHAVKNFTTAEGGACSWKHIDGVDDDELYHRFQLYSLHGQSKDALAKTQIGAWEYDIVGTWYKCNMTDIMGGIGLAQLERYPSLLARRKEIIEKFDAALKPLGVKTLAHYTDDHMSSGHLYITRVPGITDAQRREIITKMAENGVSTNVHYKPLPMHTAYKKLGFNIADYPNAFACYENEITLPLHTKLTDEEVEYIIDNYIKILKEYI